MTIKEICDEFGLDPICGFECPDGWLEIVHGLFLLLSERVPGWDPKLVSQVKVKFGQLRIYDDNGQPAEDLIDLATHVCKYTHPVTGEFTLDTDSLRY